MVKYKRILLRKKRRIIKFLKGQTQMVILPINNTVRIRLSNDVNPHSYSQVFVELVTKLNNKLRREDYITTYRRELEHIVDLGAFMTKTYLEAPIEEDYGKICK